MTENNSGTITQEQAPDARVRILVDLMTNGTQFYFLPEHLGVEEDGITAEKVIEALRSCGDKASTARDLDLFDEDTWSIYVQVVTPDGVTRAEW